MALTELGFKDITEAQDGKEAAGIADKQKFDLICTDFQMPEMTGRQPDAVIACVGGGSNAMGLFYPYIADESVRLIGVEAAGQA